MCSGMGRKKIKKHLTSRNLITIILTPFLNFISFSIPWSHFHSWLAYLSPLICIMEMRMSVDVKREDILSLLFEAHQQHLVRLYIFLVLHSLLFHCLVASFSFTFILISCRYCVHLFTVCSNSSKRGNDFGRMQSQRRILFFLEVGFTHES